MDQDDEETNIPTTTTIVRNDNKPVIIEPHTLTLSHNQGLNQVNLFSRNF